LHEARIQFKYGDTWQFDYHIGDTLKWGGNDFGSPELKNVKTYGIIESTTCPFCGKENINEEYDLFVRDSIITAVAPIQRVEDYLNGEDGVVID
jgi:hypothetical protein